MTTPFAPVALVPAFQAETTVGAVVRGIRAAVSDVLVVDDGSTDRSGAEAVAAGARVLRLSSNGGKGMALRAGLAEVIKYGAICDAPFLDWLEAHAGALLSRDHDALTEAIARSCQHKADIVERDPFEHGDRALLNLGHTFGHAIEAEQGYSGVGNDALNHGEAVAVGMVLAARLSAHLGMAAAADTVRMQALLDRFGLPTRIPAGLEPDLLLARMRLDKKATASGLRLVLWRGPGRAEVVAGVDEDAVRAVLAGGG